MFKFTVFLLIFILYLDISECGVNRSYGPNNSYNSRYAGSRNRQIAAAPPIPPTTQAPMTAKEYLQTQGTFSAWSLILVIISVIVSGLAVYYVVLCYPFLCSTEKNYRFMDGSSSTMTAETSPSMPSIENFEDNGKSIEQQYSTHNEKSINDYIIHESGPPPLQMVHKTLELK